MATLLPVSTEPRADVSTAVGFRNLSKHFGSVAAVDDVSFDVKAGTVHAVLGENGAGKTTLMRLLAGVLQPDDGHILVGGSPVTISNPRTAQRLGIGMVHQHLALVPALTVGENLLLGDDSAPFYFSPQSYSEKLFRNTARFGLRVDPSRPVWQLTAPEREIVEISRVLIHGSRIVVLDEPTAYLNPVEGDRVLSEIKRLTRQGCTVLLVTHKLREIESFADAVTVLRGGRHVVTAPTARLSIRDLTEAMMGPGVVIPVSTGKRNSGTSRKRLLKVDGLGIRSRPGQNVEGVVSFVVNRGDILGIAGIAGNGQVELACTLAGLRRPEAGQITIDSSSMERVAFVPADRTHLGAPGNLSIEENLTLRQYRQPPYSSFGLLSRGMLRMLASELRERFGIRSENLERPTSTLSGGNIQRVILARELSRDFDLLIAHNPTAGLDVAGAGFVRGALQDAARSGAGVVLISDDLDEIFEVADSLLVLSPSGGRGPFPTDETDRHTVGRIMLSEEPEACLESA